MHTLLETPALVLMTPTKLHRRLMAARTLLLGGLAVAACQPTYTSRINIRADQFEGWTCEGSLRNFKAWRFLFLDNWPSDDHWLQIQDFKGIALPDGDTIFTSEWIMVGGICLLWIVVAQVWFLVDPTMSFTEGPFSAEELNDLR